jgi:integrase
MARNRNSFPSYLEHKQSGKGRAVWTDTLGIRHYRMLPGLFNSEESKTAFARLQLELATSPAAATSDPVGITMNEVLVAYLDYAERHYRDEDGKPTNEVLLIKIVSRHVREVYGETPAANFGPLALKATRQRFVELGWCRKTVNQQVERLRRIFRWSVAEELIPPAVHQALVAVEGLRVGRSEAPESEPIKPVEAATVAATMPFLNRHLRAMVQLQQLTGMRPGEVCRMRMSEIDRTADLWMYRPSKHKSKHRGKTRVIMIGPRARSVIEEFISGGSVVDPSGPMFSPLRARAERFETMRAKRKSKVQPSQATRRVARPTLLPRMEYTPNAYALAVRVAAKKAGVEHWHPNRLRHLYASEVRKGHGLEAAQVLLGHSRADVTQVYAERNEELAVAVAAKIG